MVPGCKAGKDAGRAVAGGLRSCDASMVPGCKAGKDVSYGSDLGSYKTGFNGARL